MNKDVLYLGDTKLDRSASYLAGVMSYAGISFDYLASDQKFKTSLLTYDYKAVIISDYPAANFSAEQLGLLVAKIENGTGLVMIGGWESFTGNGGDYNNTLFAEALPVVMKSEDDRINFSSPCVITKENSHDIIDSLPFDRNSSIIGGLNAVEVKKGALLLLSAVEYKISMNDKNVDFEKNRKYPLLVIGDYYLGKIAAFTSDVAPHWVGPLVDWGDERITAKANGAAQIEVGNWYAAFFVNLIRWLCKRKYETISLI